MIELQDLILKVMAVYGNGYEQPGDSKSVQRVSGALVQGHDARPEVPKGRSLHPDEFAIAFA